MNQATTILTRAALVAAGAGVFHPMVLDDPDLLGNDVELFADFDTDLDQGDTVVGTNAL